VLKVTPDANILISGVLYRRGKCHQLLQNAIAGEVNLTVSQPIIDEVAEILYRKFGASEDFIAETRALIGQAARVVRPAVQLNVITEDPDDDRILECAVSAGSDYIVTGDKDLLRLKQYDAIRIVSVAEFLDVAQQRR
jgi:uncharacterized protein